MGGMGVNETNHLRERGVGEDCSDLASIANRVQICDFAVNNSQVIHSEW